MNRNWSVRLALLTSLAFATVAPAPAAAQQAQKPNILVIMADEVGYWNISVYNRGMMGRRTPYIDRIASEGEVGLAAAKEGSSEKDPAIAELLKPPRYG